MATRDEHARGARKANLIARRRVFAARLHQTFCVGDKLEIQGTPVTLIGIGDYLTVRYVDGSTGSVHPLHCKKV